MMNLQSDQEEIKDRADQLHTLSNSLPGMMTYQVVREHDGKMKFTYVSESVLLLTGKTNAEVLEDPAILYNLIIEEDKSKIFEAEEISWKELSVFDVVVRSKSSSGEIRWLHIRSVPRKLDDGRVIWDGVHTDITDRKRAEQKLAESEKNLRHVLSSMADDFYAIDLNYQIIIINQSAEKNLEKAWGKPVKAGTNILGLIPAEERKRFEKNFLKVFKGEKIEYELHHTNYGISSWVNVSIIPVADEKGVITGAHVTTKDISERKKNEEVIKQSEERYRILVENAPEALVVLDTNSGKFVSVSETAVTLFKMSKEDLLKTGPIELSPEYQPNGSLSSEYGMKKINEAINGGKPIFEWMHCDSRGKLIPTEVRLVLLPSENQILIRGSIIDITERKKNEDTLRKSEERYRSLIEQASDAIMITDLQGNFIDVNSSLCEMFGYDKQELLRSDISSLIDPQQLKEQPMRFDELKKDQHVFSHRRMMHKNGSIIEVEANVKMIPGGGILAIGRDITERKKAEDRIRSSEETRRLIMNAALDAIIIMDAAGIVTEWNPHAEKIFGWKEDEILGKSLSDSIIPAQYRKQHKKGLTHYLQTGEAAVLNRLIEITAINKNGNEFPVELSIVPIKQGADIFFCGFLRDISERKKAEQQLIESENRLRTILNTEPECIKLLSSEGELLDMNPAGLAMIEADSLEQVKGKYVETLIAPAYKKQFHRLTLDVFKGRSGRLEFELIGLKGTRRWMETHAVPLKDADGKIISLLSVTRDISDRKKGEEDLLREKNLSDSIINSLPGIFYLMDERGKFLRWNKNMETVSGYSTEEMHNLKALDFFDADEKKLIRKKIADVFEKGQEDVEAHFLTKDRKKIPYYFNGWRVIFEGKPCLIGVGIDITERKKAELEMLVANERFSLIARATNDFVWDAYLDVKKVWWNDNYYTQLGWKKGIEIPGGDSWEKHIHKNDKKRVVERLTRILDHTNDSIWTDEYRFGKADGTYITVYDRGYIMRDDKGKAYRVIGAMTDISEIKKAEELLNKSYQDIRRLASHLEKVREDERIRIAREIHDELGQQLTVLKMDASWLNKNTLLQGKKVKQRIADLIQMIDKTIFTIRRIASELRPSVLDDLGLLPALEWLSSDFEKRSGIKTKFVSELTELNLDVNINTAMFRIFQESLTNVARHAEASEVYAVLKKENGDLLIIIKDNGKGFVVPSIENKKTLGILGIKERVALIDGEYEIISSPNKGTTVKVRVPVSSII